MGVIMKRFIFAALVLGMTTVMADETSAYLQVNGISGDSQSSGHKNWFELTAFDQGLYRWNKKGGTRNYLPRESGNEVAGQLMVTRLPHKPALDIYYGAAKGTYFGNVTIDIPVHTGMGQKYIRWHLFDVIITGVHIDRVHGSRGLPVEEIIFSYQYAEWDRPESVSSNTQKRSNSVQR
jgi:type VI secretion system secreted protein Hcp